MKHRNLAEKLLKKAEQDLAVLKLLKSESDISSDILGFHAQQSAEKMIKAVLAYHHVKYPFTHRLTDLIDSINDQGIIFPKNFDEIRFLTPFAVEFRYDFIDDEEDFDAEAAYILLKELRIWVKSLIDI